MCRLVINGGRALNGRIDIQGSKNAVLPIIAATLLTDGECVIHNCPDITDVRVAFEILKSFGSRVKYENHKASVCNSGADGVKIGKELMQKMRSSVMFLGAMLARFGEALICMPGGCRLGSRPIDMHIDAFKKLGAEIYEDGECIFCRMGKITERDITLLFPSVGVTENIMLLCAGRNVELKIVNPAREPEIVDLQNFLNKMGADIHGAGTDVIKIYPSSKLCGCEYRVISDRIAAITYACMTAVCGGDVFLDGTEAAHLRIPIAVLRESGCIAEPYDSGLRIISDRRLKSINNIKTLPYPGLPTDIQPLLGTVFSVADGCSVICETIFESRYGYVDELIKLGAKIDKKGSCILIHGVPELFGANTAASDLRGGAALVAAGLAARGRTVVGGVEFIDRGYDGLENCLARLGADIERVPFTNT